MLSLQLHRRRRQQFQRPSCGASCLSRRSKRGKEKKVFVSPPLFSSSFLLSFNSLPHSPALPHSFHTLPFSRRHSILATECAVYRINFNETNQNKVFSLSLSLFSFLSPSLFSLFSLPLFRISFIPETPAAPRPAPRPSPPTRLRPHSRRPRPRRPCARSRGRARR